jgi:hypothetical protein
MPPVFGLSRGACLVGNKAYDAPRLAIDELYVKLTDILLVIKIRAWEGNCWTKNLAHTDLNEYRKGRNEYSSIPVTKSKSRSIHTHFF